MKTEGLIGIIVLGLMCLIGITLIFLDSSIPILATIVLGAIFALFIFLEKGNNLEFNISKINH